MMETLHEWDVPNGHRLVLVRETRRGGSPAGSASVRYVVLWLQFLGDDLGKVTDLGCFSSRAQAHAFARRLAHVARRDAA